VRSLAGGWREGDAILLARSRSPLTLAGSEAQARFGSPGGSPSLDLGSEVALVRYTTRVARVASLVHDVAEGGLAVALAEAALWSGVGASVELDDDPLTLFGEVGGQVVVALPAEMVATAQAGAFRDVPRPQGGDRTAGIRSADPRSRTGFEPDPTGSEVEVRRIGTVGGDRLLGLTLDELREAYEGAG
jgi:phosphoribosylformylglycinamidine (FGAM) synthase-like enzyme